MKNPVLAASALMLGASCMGLVSIDVKAAFWYQTARVVNVGSSAVVNLYLCTGDANSSMRQAASYAGPLAPGQSHDWTGNNSAMLDGYGNYFWVLCSSLDGQTSKYFRGGDQVTSDYGTHIIEVSLDANTNYCASVGLKNDLYVNVNYYIMSNHVQVGMGELPPQGQLLNYLGPSAHPYEASVIIENPVDHTMMVDNAWSHYMTNCDSAGVGTPAVGNGLQSGIVTNSGAGILLTNGINPGMLSWGTNDIEAGLSALLEAISQAAAQAHHDASNAFGGGGGTSSGAVSNGVAGLDADLKGIEGELGAITNLLLPSAALGSAFVTTNIDGSMTNGSLAWATGQSEAESVLRESHIAQMMSDAGGLGGVFNDPGGDCGFTVHSFVGTVGGKAVPDFAFDFLAPTGAASWFSQIPTLIHAIWVYVLYLLYATFTVKRISDCWGIILSFKGTSLEPLSVELAGFGGNVLGYIVRTGVNVGILVVYAGALAALATVAAGGFSWSSLMAVLGASPLSGTSGPVTQGLHLVFAYFPIGLAVGLFGARMCFNMSMMGVLAAGRYAVRWLPGV